MNYEEKIKALCKWSKTSAYFAYTVKVIKKDNLGYQYNIRRIQEVIARFEKTIPFPFYGDQFCRAVNLIENFINKK